VHRILCAAVPVNGGQQGPDACHITIYTIFESVAVRILEKVLVQRRLKSQQQKQKASQTT
jgi:hypothetical protein